MYSIMIVEDDAAIAGQLKAHLEQWGYKADCAEDFGDITGEFERLSPQLILLDITLPFHNGFYWCEQIRKRSGVPVIFISSAADNMNIVTAVGAGADDFIAKPFDLSVLTAKIKALLRRSYDYSSADDIVLCGGVTLDISRAEATAEGTVQLTKNELMILLTLMRSRGKIVSRDKLMQKMWETDSFVDENTLSVNVARLRKKLESIGAGGLIVTKIKMGYIIE